MSDVSIKKGGNLMRDFPLSGFKIESENCTSVQLLQARQVDFNVCTKFTPLNRQIGKFNGVSRKRIVAKNSALQQYCIDCGYPFSDTAMNRINQPFPHCAPSSQRNAKLFAKAITKALQRYIAKHYPDAKGIYTEFDRSELASHVFTNATSADDSNPTHEPTPHQHPHKPDTPNNKQQAPEPDDKLAKQEAEHQQQLLHQAQIRVHLTEEEKEKQKKLKHEAYKRYIRNKKANEERRYKQRIQRYLEHEEAQQRALKHPTTTRKHGNRPSGNNHAHKTEGPELF